MNKKKWICIISIIIIVLCIGIQIDIKKENKSEEKNMIEAEEEIIKVELNQLMKSYDDNEVMADNNYKDKLIELSFIVDCIEKDILGDIYVTSKNEGMTGAQCYFEDKKETDKVAKLKKGNKITVIGTCNGKVFNILVKDCKIKDGD